MLEECKIRILLFSVAVCLLSIVIASDAAGAPSGAPLSAIPPFHPGEKLVFR